MPILPKGIQDGIDKAGKGVGKIFGKKEKPEHPMKTHNAAQERINKMRAVLETIEFEEGLISPEDVEKFGLQETKDALVYALSDPNITKDDMSKIDEILLFACDSLAEAVKKGRANVADWSCIALSVGLSFIRADIPPSEAGDETERLKQIQARSDWFETYRTIINAFKEYDDTQKAIRDQRIMRNERQREYNEMFQQREEALKTPEGQKAELDLEKNERNPGNMSDEARELQNALNEMKGKLALIKSLNAKMSANMALLTQQNTNIELARQALTNSPRLYDEKLQAKFKQLREHEAQRLQETFTRVATEQEELEMFSDKIEAIMKSPDARTITRNAMKFREYLDAERERSDKLDQEAELRAKQERERVRERTEAIRTRVRVPNE